MPVWEVLGVSLGGDDEIGPITRSPVKMMPASSGPRGITCVYMEKVNAEVWRHRKALKRIATQN